MIPKKIRSGRLAAFDPEETRYDAPSLAFLARRERNKLKRLEERKEEKLRRLRPGTFSAPQLSGSLRKLLTEPRLNRQKRETTARAARG